MKKMMTVMVAAVLILAGCSGGSDDATATPSTSLKVTSTTVDPDLETQDAYEACQGWISDRLKSPATAIFPDLDDPKVRATEGEFYRLSTPTPTFKFESYVDSENGFGALIRTGWSCEVFRYGAGWNDVSVEFNEDF